MKSLFAGFVVVATLAAGCGGGASPGGTGGAGGKITGSGGAGGSGGVTGSGGSAGSGGASGSGGAGGGSGGASGSGGGSGGSGGAGGGSGGTTDGGSTTDGGNDARDAAVESGGSDVAALAPQLPAGGRCVPGTVYPAVMPASPQPTMVRAGFSFLEGPLWMASQNALYFSDFTLSAADGLPGRMHKYTPATNAFEIFLPTPATNGLAVDADGMIVAASHQDRKLIRINPTTKQITDVVGGAMFGGMPFNCLNDVVIRNDGNMYFSDPSYQRGNRPGQPDTSYFRMAPNGTVTKIGARTQPNGVSLSPDGQYLYVASAEDNGGGIRRHPVNADGSLGAATNFSPEISDGMAVDCAGNLYLNARSRVQVVSPAGQNVVTLTGFSTANGNFVTNAAFGGPDGKTLYVTTSNILYRFEMNVPGLPN